MLPGDDDGRRGAPALGRADPLRERRQEACASPKSRSLQHDHHLALHNAQKQVRLLCPLTGAIRGRPTDSDRVQL